MLPDILNYVPDPNNGRPLVGAKVYFLIGGYDAPDRDSDLDITKIAPITANGDVVPQPLYTSKGGTLRVGSQVNQPALSPSGLTQKAAVYDKCGKLVYQVEYSGQGQYVLTSALAAVDSNVLIGGITAEALVALAQGGGGGSGNGINYVQTMPAPGTAGTTLFQQNSYDLGFTINDGDSIPIVEFSMLGASAYSASGGGGGATYTFANSTGSGNTLLKTISPTSYEWKRIIAGANVSITDDGNALTINSSGGGGGGGTTTTLSNAGATGLGLVMPISGADYPIKRLEAGTNVTITDNGTYYTIAATGGGGGIASLQNVNDAVGVGIYKETTAGVGYFRRLQSSDGSLSVASDVDDIDITSTAVTKASLKALPAAAAAVEGVTYWVTGFYAGSTTGGGRLVWQPSASKSLHNGVTHYAPEALAAWDGTQAGIATLLSWTGAGNGVWIRTNIPTLTPYHAGAVPNIGMDCTLPMQKVITYLGSNGGGKLRLPAGTWDITSQLNLAGQSVVIEGDSRFASVIRQKTLNTKTLNITGNFCGIKSLSTIYDGTPTSGATAIYVTSSYVTLEDFCIRSSYEGVHFNGGGAVAGKVTNFEILDYEAVGLHASDLNDLFVDNFIMNAGNNTRGAFGGIRLENKVEAFICSNGDILLGVFSMIMDAVSNSLGNRPAYNNFTNVFFDSAVNSIQINKCVETDFVGCWFSGGRSGGGNSGAVVSNSRSIRFTNTRFFNSGGSGVVVNNTSTDVTFINCKAESNSVTAGDGIAHGFQFANGTQEFKVIGCTASNGLYTGKQGYGILIGTGCDKFSVVDNNLIGNLNGPLIDGTSSASDKTIIGNKGYNKGGIQSYSPVVSGSVTAGTCTYSIQDGKYHEVGNMVFFSASITWSDHTGTGGILVSLPHSVASFGQRVPLSVYYENLTAGAGKQVAAFIGTSDNVLAIRALDPIGAGGSNFFDAAATLHISGFYLKA